MSEKKTGLGRGLTSLLGEDISVVSELKNEGKNIKIIPVEQIKPGPWQARKNFDATDLETCLQTVDRNPCWFKKAASLGPHQRSPLIVYHADWISAWA